jgi:hypothetical protein
MGNDRDFDYGLDITECGICKFYAAHNPQELAPYMCLSEFIVSRGFDRGLVGYHTIAREVIGAAFDTKLGEKLSSPPCSQGGLSNSADKLGFQQTRCQRSFS